LRKEPNHNARNRFQSLHQQLQRVYEKFDSYVDYFYQPCRYDGFAILSKYLKEDLNLSYAEVGWIMVAFGMGSMLGSWLGGKLSDKIGFTKSWFSVCSPAEYYFFHTIHTSFLGLCAGMFIIMTVADMFPAMFVSWLPIQNPRIAPGH
jgi:predicted MFS family arabinose efflux permease